MSRVTYFPDGSVYSFMDGEPEAVNVGWLDAEHAFPTQAPSDEFVAALARLTRCRHSVRRTRGFHRCQFYSPSHGAGLPPPVCAQDGDREFFIGGAEVRVRGPDAVVFAAPDLIIHYVKEHRYAHRTLSAMRFSPKDCC